MLNRRLFLHPVGTMPLQARWYLALCGMVLFALVGLHFAIQVETQQRAEQVLGRWADQAGFKVSNVRYRLLRNALSVDDIVLQRDDMKVHIDSVLMKAGPAALAGETPDIYELRIRGLSMHIYDSRRIEAWRDLLPDVGVFRIHRWQVEGDVMLDRTGRSLHLRALRASADEYGGRTHWQLSAQLAGGYVHGHGASALEYGDVQGELYWGDMQARQLSAWLGETAEATQFEGALSWAGVTKRLTFDGQAQLLSGQRSASALKWRGDIHEGKWQMAVHAEAWPLVSMHGLIPVRMAHGLRDGHLNAAVALQGDLDAGTWKASGKQARIVGLLLTEAGTESADGAVWRVGDISCANWRIDGMRHHVRIGRMSVLNAEGYLRPENMLGAVKPLGWLWSVDEMQLHHAQLHIVMANDEMRVPMLQGRIALKDNHFEMALVSERATNEDEASIWQLQGNGTWLQGGLDDVQLQVKGQHVALSMLRPVLGLASVDASMAPISLDGRTDFTWRLQVTEGVWSMQGKFDMQSLNLSHAGDRWYFNELSLAFAVRDDGKEREIREIRGSTWRYTASLTPMSLQPPEQFVQPQDHWWKRWLREHGWKLRLLRLQQGSVAVGQDDDVWLDNINLELRDVAEGRWSDITMQGDWDGGIVVCDGKWKVLASGFQWVGRLRIEHALPFFLRHWLMLSGLPVLDRGRWSAEMKVQQTNDDKGYAGRFYFQLAHPLLGKLPQPDADPLLARIGYPAQQVMMRLAQQPLRMSFRGDWQQPLSWGRFVDMMLEHVQMLMSDPAKQMSAPDYRYHTPETQIRLHERVGLTPNERLRLRKILYRVRANKGWLLELHPDIASQSLDARTIARIRFTEHLIEAYGVRLGLATVRILPRWPVGSPDGPEVGGIRVLAVSVR